MPKLYSPRNTKRKGWCSRSNGGRVYIHCWHTALTKLRTRTHSICENKYTNHESLSTTNAREVRRMSHAETVSRPNVMEFGERAVVIAPNLCADDAVHAD